MTHCILLLLPALACPPAAPAAQDTIRLEIGSPEVDGRVFPVHRARNRVYIGDAATPSVSWTNELQLGDSAGRPVMRWITLGEPAPGSSTPAWELYQTYDARTMAPMAYLRTASNGSLTRLTIDGTRVRGVKRAPGDTALVPVDQTIDRPGFFSGASDLVPMAAGMQAGKIMTAPVWGPNMTAAEERVFTVFAQESVMVEGSAVMAWKVEEHVAATGKRVATWWLTESSPYMVLAEVPLPDGQTQRITGVDLGPRDP